MPEEEDGCCWEGGRVRGLGVVIGCLRGFGGCRDGWEMIERDEVGW